MAHAVRTPLTPGSGGDTPRSRTLARPGKRASQAKAAAPSVLPSGADEAGAPVAAAPAAVVAPLVARGLALTWRAVAVLVVLVLLFLACLRSLIVYFDQQREIVAVQAEIAARQAEIDEMRSEIERWQDPGYVAAQARERLGWVVPGETGYVVVGADGQPVGGAAIDRASTLPAGEHAPTWYEQLWGSVRAADDPQPEQP